MIKFKAKYAKHLTRVDKIEYEMKQAYSIYYGQISDEMKASLNEYPEYEKSLIRRTYWPYENAEECQLQLQEDRGTFQDVGQCC